MAIDEENVENFSVENVQHHLGIQNVCQVEHLNVLLVNTVH